MFEAIVAGGQQRLRPIISTTVSTIGGILTLTITDELWEGLGVVIIFGIAFATVLTLIVVPVMYSIFEGLRYYVISAFRGARWKEAPRGTVFYFSRRRYARLGAACIIGIQLLVLASGLAVVGPGVVRDISQTTLQAPSLLKLAIEATVYGLEIFFKVTGLIAVLLIPTWAGLIFLMAKRSREGYFVDITPDGVSIGSPVDRFFIGKEEITQVELSRFFPKIPAIRISNGRRHIVIRKLLPSEDGMPEKKPLRDWLAAEAPTQDDIVDGMLSLKKSLDALIDGKV
jgi:multidrug efflux pump